MPLCISFVDTFLGRLIHNNCELESAAYLLKLIDSPKYRTWHSPMKSSYSVMKVTDTLFSIYLWKKNDRSTKRERNVLKFCVWPY